MKLSFTCILRGMALSALTNAVMPVVEAWAAEEMQVLRKAEPTAGGARMMPFTTFQQEELALANSVPCKWISKDGRLGPSYGGGRYDFLCKGGDFATVSLYMNKSESSGDGVAKVILLYRDWPVNANPNAGEALIAQQFLQHVTGRFVPAAIAGTVMDAFWANSTKSWNQGGVSIKFVVEKQRDQLFSVRRLEITGTGASNQLSAQVVKFIPVVTPTDAGLTVVPTAPVTPVGTKVIIYDVSGKKPVVEGHVIPGVATAPLVQPPAVVNTGLTKAMPIPVQEAPATVVVPAPLAVLPAPKPQMPVAPVNTLVVPQNAPAGAEAAQPGAIQMATPAELNTSPAPESKVTPVAPPQPSGTLVPNTQDLVNGRGLAPSNFDIYNKAVELTKNEEAKAQIAKVDEAKVTASKPVKVSATTIVTPSTIVVPPLKAVPTPGTQPATPATVAGEGLGVKVPTVPGVDEVGLPQNYNGPRSSEVRPLPQLKFVPKAEPLRNTDEVIQFEDEKSKL